LTTYISQGSVATDLRKVIVLTTASTADPFWIQRWKYYENWSTNNKVLPFGARGSGNYASPCIRCIFRNTSSREVSFRLKNL